MRSLCTAFPRIGAKKSVTTYSTIHVPLFGRRRAIDYTLKKPYSSSCWANFNDSSIDYPRARKIFRA
jgi:hypothetical protein